MANPRPCECGHPKAEHGPAYACFPEACFTCRPIVGCLRYSGVPRTKPLRARRLVTDGFAVYDPHEFVKIREPAAEQLLADLDWLQQARREREERRQRMPEPEWDWEGKPPPPPPYQPDLDAITTIEEGLSADGRPWWRRWLNI